MLHGEQQNSEWISRFLSFFLLLRIVYIVYASSCMCRLHEPLNQLNIQM